MSRSNMKKNAAPGLDMVAPEILALPVPVNSIASEASQASQSSIPESSVVKLSSNITNSSTMTLPPVRSSNPTVIEAMRLKSERLKAEKLIVVTDTQSLFETPVAASSSPVVFVPPVVAATIAISAPVIAILVEKVFSPEICLVEQVSGPTVLPGVHLPPSNSDNSDYPL